VYTHTVCVYSFFTYGEVPWESLVVTGLSA